MDVKPGDSGKAAMKKVKGGIFAVKTGGQFLLALLGMMLMFAAALYGNGRELIGKTINLGSIMGECGGFSLRCWTGAPICGF